MPVSDFDTLVPAPELSLADANNNMTTQLYRERQLWSGNESVEIRYGNGSFVAGTSALSPGVPFHMYIMKRILSFQCRTAEYVFIKA